MSFLLLALLSTFAQAERITAKVYDPAAADPKSPAYLYENEKTMVDGKWVSQTRYTDLEGKLLVEEETTYENQKVVKYLYKQFQTEEYGELNVQNGKVHYSFTKRGETDTEKEEVGGEMIVGDNVNDTIARHWDELMAGKEVRVRFLVVEELDSFGFKFFKDKENEKDVEIIMKPSSFFIAAFVPEIRITVEKSSLHRIVKAHGRLPVRKAKVNPPKSRKDLKALDGIIEFAY